MWQREFWHTKEHAMAGKAESERNRHKNVTKWEYDVDCTVILIGT